MSAARYKRPTLEGVLSHSQAAPRVPGLAPERAHPSPAQPPVDCAGGAGGGRRITIRNLLRAADEIGNPWADDAKKAWRHLRALGVPAMLLRGAWETTANLPPQLPLKPPFRKRERVARNAEGLADELEKLSKEWPFASQLMLASFSDKLSDATRQMSFELMSRIPASRHADAPPALLRVVALAIRGTKLVRSDKRFVSQECFFLCLIDKFRTDQNSALPYKLAADLISAAYCFAGINRTADPHTLRKNYENFRKRAG